MAWARLQSASAKQASNNVASFGVTFSTANLSAGTKIICAVQICDNGSAVTTSNVKDGAGNTFTKVAAQANNNSSANGEISLWAIDTPAGDVGTKPTITATFSSSTNAGVGIFVQEASGLAPGSTLALMADGTAGTNFGTAGSSTGSPVYHSTAHYEYLVAVFGDDGSTGACTWTKPAALTADPNAINTAGTGDVGFAYGSSTGGTEAGSWAISSANKWGAILVAFRLAPVYNLTQPARSRVPQIAPRGRVVSGRGAPVSNPVPPVTPAVIPPRAQPVRAPVPQPFSRGRAVSNGATPVHNPSSGPPFRLPSQPAAARRPLPPRGRVYGNPGIPAVHAGPPFRQATAPARTRIPQVAPRGRAYGNPGAAPVHAGPAVYPLPGPVRARRPLPPRGRAYGNLGTPVRNPSQGPAFPAAPGPAKARALPFSKGRYSANAGAPVHNPSSGPPVTPLAGPARARRPLPPRGRVTGNAGAPVQNPAPPVTAPAFALTSPVRAKLPPQLTGRAATMSLLPAPSNPSQGPAFSLPAQPAQARRPLPPRGHVHSRLGAPVSNPPPPVTQVPAYRLSSPVRARLLRPLTGRAITTKAVALTPPVYPQQVLTGPVGVLAYLLRTGHVQASAQTSPVRNPSSGPPAPPLTSPAGVRVIFNRIGAGITSPAGVVQNPVVTPAVVYPLTQPVRARRPLPAPGRAATMASLPAPVAPPATIPPPPPLTSPARSRILPPPRGRAYGRLGAPVSNPVPSSGPPLRPLTQPVRARQPLPARGRDYLPLPYKAPVNPAPSAGPVLYPLTQPARSRVTPPPRGRAYGNAGAPVRNPAPPVTAPAPPLASPVGLRVIFTRTGTGSGSPGAPVQNPPSRTAPFYPLNKALRAQPPVFLKGRAAGNTGAPVRNPTQGPQFRQATSPARYRITLPPRGRVYGNIGAPVHNPVEGPVPPGTLYLTPATITQGRPYAATTIADAAPGVLTISSATGAVTAITIPAAELTISNAIPAGVYTAAYTAIYGGDSSGAVLTISNPSGESVVVSHAATTVLVAGPASAGSGQITAPPDSDIPSPDPVVVPAYVQR